MENRATRRKPTPPAGAQSKRNGKVDGQAQLLTTAIMEAGLGSCECGPCETLRKMGKELLVQMKDTVTP